MVFQIATLWFASVVFSATAAQSFAAVYGPTKSAQYAILQNHLRQTRFLEQLAGALSQNLTLEDQLVLTTTECGTSNAFYAPKHNAIVLCLELITQVTEGIRRDLANIATPDEVNNAAAGALSFIFMHELGHLLIDRLHLPVLGREEDAADEIGVFFLLHDGRAQQTLPGALWFFRSKSLGFTRSDFSDEHSVGPQRQSNLACWAYGKDQALFNHLLRSGMLTKERAARCGKEYEQLNSSVRHLLEGKVQLPQEKIGSDTINHE
jgi:hypothetical protein